MLQSTAHSRPVFLRAAPNQFVISQLIGMLTTLALRFNPTSRIGSSALNQLLSGLTSFEIPAWTFFPR